MKSITVSVKNLFKVAWDIFEEDGNLQFSQS